MSGAGTTKRVYDLGDGRAMALPNIQKGIPKDDAIATSWLEGWTGTIGDEARQAAKLRALGFETQEYKLTEAKVGEGAIPALVMPSFAALAEKGTQVKDIKFHTASMGSSVMFGTNANLHSPEHVTALMQGMVDDCARLVAYGVHMSTDSYNVAIKDTKDTPAHDRTAPGDLVTRKQEARMFLFDIANSTSVDGPPPLAHVPALAERSLRRAFETVLSAVGHDEVSALAQAGTDRWHWDEAAQGAFAIAQPKLLAQVIAKTKELLPLAQEKVDEAKREADAPPLALPGGGSPDILTGQGKSLKRGG